jgi:hypothetical protein
MFVLEVDKIGSAVSPLGLTKTVFVTKAPLVPRVGDVVAVRALSESVTYGNLELPTGRLAKINRGDCLLGVLGKRRALKGFVGDVPNLLRAGDKLQLLNMGGVTGVCLGHHSSLSDAIELEFLGAACDFDERVLNIADKALPNANELKIDSPLVIVAGTCMNSGKTAAVTEIIKQAAQSGWRVAGAKLSGVACLRDTLTMQDAGACATASFLDCGLPSTVEAGNLAPMAKAVLNHLFLAAEKPDLIVVELGDGILGGYAVDSILQDAEIKKSARAFVFCASDYVGAWGGVELLKRQNIKVDVVAGSVTDSQMGEDYIKNHFGIKAGNARRDGKRLFELICQTLRSNARGGGDSRAVFRNQTLAAEA